MKFSVDFMGKKAVSDRLFGNLQVDDDGKARKLLGWKPVVSMYKQLLKMSQDQFSLQVRNDLD